jgi:hypothetical protein
MSAPASPLRHSSAKADTIQFELLSDAAHFILQIAAEDRARISVPRTWLVPAENEEGSYVSSCNYDTTVTSFHIGKDRIGLHISSYEIQKEGSAQASAGRDVFLVYDAKNRRIYPGIIDLGITKERYRSAGCFFATNTRFILADINRDGACDIGIIKEDFKCTPLLRQKGSTEMPVYEIHPVQWRVFDEDRWVRDDRFSGEISSAEYRELPLIGLVKSPVDFVKEICMQKRVLLMEYSDFGPQSMCYGLIGFEWYQWDDHGDPDPRKRYDIKVVVYKDISLEKVEKSYPVSKDTNQDYRYVEYRDALEYLDAQLGQIEEFREEDSARGDDALFAQLTFRLLETRKEIVTKFLVRTGGEPSF